MPVAVNTVWRYRAAGDGAILKRLDFVSLMQFYLELDSVLLSRRSVLFGLDLMAESDVQYVI